MKPDTIQQALEALRQEIVQLGQRVAALEAASRTPSEPDESKPDAPARQSKPDAPAREPAKPQAAAEEISEEILLVISAAIAAFLGKKAPIRQIRLLGSAAWAQQGRVIIQASHSL